MLGKHIADLIKKQMEFVPTSSQLRLIDGLGDFVTLPENETILLVKGYAGTGKTWVVSALVKAMADMEIKSVLLAPTGRAAKVFGTYANQPAYTIHKIIYRQKTSGSQMGSFNLNWNKHKDTLFIVDEASMIANSSTESSIFGSGRLLDDLIEFVQQGNNCKLIFIGDSAQLPPVGLIQSPALDKEQVEQYGMPVMELFLDEVVRQTSGSGILSNATFLRQAISSEAPLPMIQVKGYSDISKIGGDELIEKISDAYDRFGIHNSIVICRSNKRAAQYNKGIRGSILNREEELCRGDLLMVIKNNYHWTEKNEEMEFIANGDIAEVVKIYRYEEMYGFRFANVLLRFIDHNDLEIQVKVMLDTLSTESPGLTPAQNDQLYKNVMADYPDSNKKKQFEALRSNDFFNALQVKYGYAITCHKSQGGQWNTVFIDQGMIRDEEKGVDYMRWLYTAMTRATDRLYLVNFPG